MPTAVPQISTPVIATAGAPANDDPFKDDLRPAMKFVSYIAGVREAVVSSLWVAAVSTLISLVLGTLLALALLRYKFFGRDVISLLVILPIALPGIVTGIGRVAGVTRRGVLIDLDPVSGVGAPKRGLAWRLQGGERRLADDAVGAEALDLLERHDRAAQRRAALAVDRRDVVAEVGQLRLDGLHVVRRGRGLGR